MMVLAKLVTFMRKLIHVSAVRMGLKREIIKDGPIYKEVYHKDPGRHDPELGLDTNLRIEGLENPIDPKIPDVKSEDDVELWASSKHEDVVEAEVHTDLLATIGSKKLQRILMATLGTLIIATVTLIVVVMMGAPA